MLLFDIATRVEARFAARHLGYDHREVAGFIDKLTSSNLRDARMGFGVIPAQFTNGAETIVQNAPVVGALGDGKLLRQILDWLASPEGLAFIKFLLSLFMLA